jgi:hypothetical protein|tara:strand:- start:480 stop:674 length:195 start_codon:yes stop_codon:yes gene_type:complete
MTTEHDKAIYYLTKARMLVEGVIETNGDDDHILPLGANRVLVDVVDALKEEIERASDYEEYDPG